MDIPLNRYTPTAADRAVERAAEVARRLGPKAVELDKGSPLYKVCLEFEAIFIKQMLNSMRKTVEKTGLLDGGMAEDIFEDMLYDEYAKKMATTANFGLAAMIYGQLQPSA
jgi:Rod binding domain-containing protein